MFSGEVDMFLWHSMSDRFNIMCSVVHSDLKIAIAAVAGQIIGSPLGGEQAKGVAGFVVSRKP